MLKYYYKLEDEIIIRVESDLDSEAVNILIRSKDFLSLLKKMICSKSKKKFANYKAELSKLVRGSVSSNKTPFYIEAKEMKTRLLKTYKKIKVRDLTFISSAKGEEK